MNLVALPFAFTASAVAFNKRFSCGESFLDRPRKIKKCPEGQWKKSWNFALPWYTHCYTTWHGITWCDCWKLNMPRCSVPVSPWHIYAMLWCSSPWRVPKFTVQEAKLESTYESWKNIPLSNSFCQWCFSHEVSNIDDTHKSRSYLFIQG